MGGVCSIGADRDKSLNELSFDENGSEENDHKQLQYNPKAPSKNKTTPIVEDSEKKPCKGESTLCERGLSSCSVSSKERKLSKSLSQKSKTNKSKRANQTKVSDVTSILGRASTAGLGKAVEVLDTLGSSMTSLNSNSGFISGVTKKGTRISILAFEVANTIVKGSNLMQSLSEESVKHLKVVLRSEGVQNLVSNDMGELLMLAAADKRQELKVFSGEVVRFGNRSKDPRWHNLDRYFARLESEVTPPKHLKETARGEMQYLMTLVQNTAELYHELNALDRFEQDYRRRLQEEGSSVAFQKGDTIQIIRQELKNQRKHVVSLKKKSLWSKILEDVMEKLVDIIQFLDLEIHDAFRITDEDKTVKRSSSSNQRLGSAGLALHYANIITQIDTLVSRSSSVPPNTRDALYQALPLTVKSSLRNKLQSFQVHEELTAPQIRAEMEKTLQWLVPVANNTTRAHHGFGWVGEWANTGNQNLGGQLDLIRMETLHHADKENTDAIILDLVVWLHHLISKCRIANGGNHFLTKSPISISIPTQKRRAASSVPQKLTKEDGKTVQKDKRGKHTLEDGNGRELTFPKPRLTKHDGSSTSSGNTSMRESRKKISTTRRPAVTPVGDFDVDEDKNLDETAR